MIYELDFEYDGNEYFTIFQVTPEGAKNGDVDFLEIHIYRPAFGDWMQMYINEFGGDEREDLELIAFKHHYRKRYVN